MASKAKTTTNHEEIRRWAEERGAKPAVVKGTGGTGDPGMLRLDFPGYTGEDSLEHIGWDEWLQKFEDNRLALVYQEETSGGERSNFNKIIGRETARARERGIKTSRHHPVCGRAAVRGKSGSRAAASSRRKTGASATRRTVTGNRKATVGRKKVSARSERRTGRSSRRKAA